MDEEPRPIAHRGSEDVSGQLEAAISAVRDEDMLHGMHELTLDNIHNLSSERTGRGPPTAARRRPPPHNRSTMLALCPCCSRAAGVVPPV